METGELNPEYSQQMAAQICILAVRKTQQWIEKASRNVSTMLKTHKTKRDYRDRKRDFRSIRSQAKPSSTISRSQYNNKVYVDLETSQQIHPRVAEVLTKLLHSPTEISSRLLRIDLCGQRIGDVGLLQLTEGLLGGSLQQLILAGNCLTDKSMLPLTTALKTYHDLQELHLNDNQLEDSAECLLESWSYTPRLQLLNLSLNRLSLRSFFALGSLLGTDYNSSNTHLTTLYLGGNALLDRGLRILLHFVFSNALCPLRRLQLADSRLGDASLLAVGALVLLSPTLQHVDITRNAFVDDVVKGLFRRCCVSGRAAVTASQCGVVLAGTGTGEDAAWTEQLDLVYAVGTAVQACRVDMEEQRCCVEIFDSERRATTRELPSLAELARQWSQWRREVQDGRAAAREGTEELGMLLHAATVCVEQSGLEAEELREAVRRGTELLEDSAPPDAIAAVTVSLQALVGELCVQRASFAAAAEQSILYSAGRDSRCVAFVFFVALEYAETLAALLRATQEENVAATAQRRKDKNKKKRSRRPRRVSMTAAIVA